MDGKTSPKTETTADVPMCILAAGTPRTLPGGVERTRDRDVEATLRQLRDDVLPEAESAVDEWREKYMATKAALGFVESRYVNVIAERDALKRENELMKSRLEQTA